MVAKVELHVSDCRVLGEGSPGQRGPESRHGVDRVLGEGSAHGASQAAVQGPPTLQPLGGDPLSGLQLTRPLPAARPHGP